MSTDDIYMRKALGLIDGGIFTWHSPPRDDPQYGSFQATAESVVEAKSLGLIYDLNVERSGDLDRLMHIVALKVYGGLTPKGRRHLGTLSTHGRVTDGLVPMHAPEVIMLQPNFYGIGFNLKALWFKLKSRLSK